MTYWLGRRPAPPPVRKTPDAVVLPELAEGFASKPFGVNAGAMMPQAPHKPPPPQRRELVIEPPPWQGREAELLIGQVDDPPPIQPGDAVRDLKAANGDDAWPEIDLGIGRPFKYEPLIVPPPPEPDWELEAKEQAEREQAERDRIKRERRDEVLRELLAEDDQAYPAKKGKP